MATSLFFNPGINVGDFLDYSFNFDDPNALGGPWLQSDETISSATVVSHPSDLIISTSLINDGLVTVWVNATQAVLGTSYVLSCSIATDKGRYATRSAVLPSLSL